MMKNFFKPEDFVNCGRIYQDCADVANEKLDALIESWPVVYGQLPISDFNWTGPKQYHDTHKARLAFIEEIVKESCKHKPAHFESDDQHINCKYCGVELRATWSEKK